eukprot:296045-Amorphochlora_amoeboformis.AAC.1
MKRINEFNENLCPEARISDESSPGAASEDRDNGVNVSEVHLVLNQGFMLAEGEGEEGRDDEQHYRVPEHDALDIDVYWGFRRYH